MAARLHLRTSLLVVLAITAVITLGYSYRQHFLSEQRRPWVGMWDLVEFNGETGPSIAKMAIEFRDDGYVVNWASQTAGQPVVAVPYAIDGPNKMTLHYTDPSIGITRVNFRREGDTVRMQDSDNKISYAIKRRHT